MKKLIVCCTTLFAVAFLFSANTHAQLQRVDDAKLKLIVAPLDRNFDIQKRKSLQTFGYEVWITTDGVLHCKTSIELKEATLKFTWPSSSSAGPNGVTTGSGGSMARKFDLTVKDNGVYRSSIKPD